MFGSRYNDVLYGYGGTDKALGGIGNDTLSGGLGADLLNGGVGTDIATHTTATLASPPTCSPPPQIPAKQLAMSTSR